ncbi:MAG: DUF748 domain-containing protein [Janthinobacterium lividum]
MNRVSLMQGKRVRRAAMAVIALAAFYLMAWLGMPPLVKSQLQRIASEKLGRQVTVGQVDFKPWTLELTLRDLRMATADGSQTQVEVRRIHVNAEMQSLLRLAPVIDAVTVEGPAVRLTHLADGRYDIDDILSKLASAPGKPPGKPARFSIYNIAISGGSVDFDDQTVKRKHALRDLVFQVPFLSNLDSQRDITTEPKLAFRLNGVAFDSAAASTPFADSRKTDARLSFKGLDLVPYLGYLPGGLPIRLQSGLLDAELRIDFERAATAGLEITGTVEAHGAKVADARSRDLLAFDSLKLTLTDVRPLDGVFHLGEIVLAAPKLKVARDASGQLNLLATDPKTGATEKVAAVPVAAPKPQMRVEIDRFVLNGGDIGWTDETTRPAAAIEARALALEVTAIRWPFDKPAQFDGSTKVGGGTLKFKGQASDRLARVQTEVDALPLSLAAPYLAQSLVPTLDGKLSGQIEVAWTPADLRLKATRIAADGLALTQAKTALASLGRFELVDAEVDMTRHTLAIASLTAVNPKVSIERDNERRWMFERWLRTPTAGDGVGSGTGAVAKVAAPKPVEAAAAPAGADRTPWKLTIASVAVDGGAVSYADKSSATPVAFDITALKLAAKNIAPGTAAASAVELSGRIGAGRADAGRFDYKGNAVLQPLSAEGRLEVSAFPAHAFKAYYADALNMDIRRAYASYKGTVRFASAPAGIDLKLAGDTSLDDFRANSASLTQSDAPGLERSNNQLLSWKTLSLRGLQVALAPAVPPTVDVRETTLTDFFARVIVDPSGRINLQNLTRTSAQNASAATPQKEAVTRREADGETTTTAGAATTPPPAKAPFAILRFGPMSLVNGKIDFTDLFVKPNYSADLSELTGKLSAFALQPGAKPESADLELHGKAQQTAALDIVGKINPLARPLELDITARMRDLDLAPLTPYAVRYAGHGIERGKLSMDVTYKILAEGRLAATNKLVLNQLRFGEEVKGAPNSLPVRLAVALLADRNGVIDVDLPISGSLNDPQFSIGSLIFKALGNLIVKAVTSPFTLLTGGLGGGSGGEASAIAFDAGSATLTASASESLDKIAKALTDRPALQMTVVGTSNLAEERDGYKRQRLRQLAQAEKRRSAARAGEDAADVAPVTDAQYAALVTAVYKRADLTKPRNVIGLAKDLPLADMEAILLEGITVTEDAMRQLAVERGAAVRDYLLAQKLPSARLFLGAPLVRSTAEAGWKPSAELKLATR